MKCPKCGNKVDDLEMKCMSCGLDLVNVDKDYGEKTIGLGIVNIVQLIAFIVIGIISIINKQTINGLIYIAIGIISYIFIKGFSDIIDLLNSIDDKINNIISK